MGIAPENLARVFERFYRTTEASDRAIKGTGLGLDIARRLIELHGGRIWAESERGSGSAFAVELPVSAADPAGGV